MLNAEQRLDAFEKHLQYRNRRAPKKEFNRFTDMELVRQASEFLKLTSWPSTCDTPEDLVQRLRVRRAKKAGATRSIRVARRKKLEAAQAAAACQGELF